MHFVLLNQFYPPDVLPTGVVLEAVAEELAAKGHRVTVVAGKSSVVSRQSSVGEKGKRGKFGNGRIHNGELVEGELEEGQLPVVSRQASVGEKGQTAGGPAPFEANRTIGAFGPEAPGGVPESTLKIGKLGDGVRVVRLWSPGWGLRKSALGKIMAYAAFYLGVGWWLVWQRWSSGGRAEVIVALTSPPYLSLLARFGAWWHGGRHAHWVMDLYPDVMVAHGMLRTGGIGHRILGVLAKWGMGGKRCHRVITLGPDMAERLQTWLPDGKAADWMPLWGTAGDAPAASEVETMRQQRSWGPDDTVFLYSGNMGLGHRFSEVLEAIPLVRTAHPDKTIHLAFFGGGKRKREVEVAVESWQWAVGSGQLPTNHPLFSVDSSSAGISSTPLSHAASNAGGAMSNPGTSQLPIPACPTGNCELQTKHYQLRPDDCPLPTANFSFSVSGYVPHGELAVHLASGDVHLASLEPAWDGMMVPSKLQGIFAAGRPVIFTGSRTSSIGRWILESGAGWVCAPGDVADHVQAMCEALDPAERRKRGAAAKAFAGEWFDREKNVGQITAWLQTSG